MLQLKNIHISFTNAHKETCYLLNGVNLNVQKGIVTALIGGNGMGKTTLFNIISGFEKRYTGTVVFNGKNIRRLSPHRISLLGIGRLFQDGQLMGGLSLMENMKLASNDTTGERPFSSLFWPQKYKKAEKDKEQKAKEILVRFFGEGNKYMDLLNSDASTLSYGEQRILSLLRLLMGKNQMLLLDEPTSGVNPYYIAMIEQIILELKEEEDMAILLIEHNMDFVRKVADVCAYLDKGEMVKVGPTADVLNDEEVRKSYLGL